LWGVVVLSVAYWSRTQFMRGHRQEKFMKIAPGVTEKILVMYRSNTDE